METSHAAMEASLEKYLPTQAVRYEWEEDQAEMLKAWEEADLPCMPGRPTNWVVPKERNIASW